ncbi:uncharacterized protein LOC127861609 isoform X5 [Dreissena polymorpha]|uniref:uncharacterized protein LOC127861609 isoform X5 n=1 Tax=Dreissena polymorpha TaxID=45954 RepID=UPI00226478EC|nr:uncharacterized protein LOC127861609 isoform X5 [Dreissena polymorpha]
MRRVKALTERFRPTSSSDVNTLEMLLNDRRVHFPCVVSMSTGNGDVQEDSGQMVLLEDSVRRIKFVRLEVVDGAIGPDGEIDRSLECRTTMVGQEMLIPLTFDCNMTLLNKAYARKRIKGNEEMEHDLR